MGKKKNNVIVNKEVKRKEAERLARRKRGSISNGMLAVIIIFGVALCIFAIYQTVGELKILWGK